MSIAPAMDAIQMLEVGYRENGITGLIPDDMGKFVVGIVRSLMSDPAILHVLRERCPSLALLSGDPLREVVGADLDALARNFLYILLEDAEFLNAVESSLPAQAKGGKQDCFEWLWDSLFPPLNLAKEVTLSSVLHFMLLPGLYKADCTHVKIIEEKEDRGGRFFNLCCKRYGRKMETCLYNGEGSVQAEGDLIDLKLSGRGGSRYFTTIALGKSPTRKELDQFVSVPTKLWLLAENLKEQKLLQSYEELSIGELIKKHPSIYNDEAVELHRWIAFCRKHERW